MNKDQIRDECPRDAPKWMRRLFRDYQAARKYHLTPTALLLGKRERAAYDARFAPHALAAEASRAAGSRALWGMPIVETDDERCCVLVFREVACPSCAIKFVA